MNELRLVLQKGGHNIPTDVIRRRYVNGIKNLFDIYIPIVDEAMIFDNSVGAYKLIARKFPNSEIVIQNNLKFTALKNVIYEG